MTNELLALLQRLKGGGTPAVPGYSNGGSVDPELAHALALAKQIMAGTMPPHHLPGPPSRYEDGGAVDRYRRIARFAGESGSPALEQKFLDYADNRGGGLDRSVERDFPRGPQSAQATRQGSSKITSAPLPPPAGAADDRGRTDPKFDVSKMSEAQLQAIIDGGKGPQGSAANVPPPPEGFVLDGPSAVPAPPPGFVLDPPPSAGKQLDYRNMSDADLERIAGAGSGQAAGQKAGAFDDLIPDRQVPQPQGPKLLANKAGGDSTEAAMLKGGATAGIKGGSAWAGAPGDLDQFTLYLIHRAHSWISGKPMEEVERQSQEKRQKVERAFAQDPLTSWMPAIPRPPTSADIAEPLVAKHGEYQPTTGLGRALMAGIEGGVAAMGPGALASGLRGARTAGSIIGGGMKAAPGGVLSGVAGDTAAVLSGDPLVGMAVGAGVPAAVSAAASPVTRYADKANHERLAAQKFYDRATDPEKAYGDLRFQPHELVEGAAPTTGMVTGDTGLLQAEKSARTHSEDFRAKLLGRETQQNAARTAEIERMGTNADPMAVTRLFQDRLRQIDDDMHGWVQQAESHVRTAHEGLPDAVPADVSGAKLRDATVSQMERALGERKRLYDAIDPDGNLTVFTGNGRDAAVKLRDSIDPDYSIPSEHAAPVIAMMAKLGEVTPFRKLTDLDATITAQMARARQAKDYTGEAQLRQMKEAVASDINNAVENQVKFQQGAVARGEMAPENTVGSRLLQEGRDWLARATGRAASAGSGADASRGAGSIPRSYRGQGEAGGRPGVSPGAEGVPGAVPNFDPAAAERLAAAKAKHADIAQTYREGPVAPFLEDTGFRGQYTKLGSEVPASAFAGGDKGYSQTSAWLKAADNAPDATGALQAMAVTRLRDKMRDGNLTPEALQSWKRQYGSSLRAIDEVSPGWSTRFDSIAKATDELASVQLAQKQALKDYQSGVAARFLKLEDQSAVARTLGNILGEVDGAATIRQIMREASAGAATGGKDNVIQSLRQAGVDYMLGRTQNTGLQGSTPTLSPDKFQRFVQNNDASLTALYGKDGMANIRRVAADMERASTAANAVTVKGGSDSGQNLSPQLEAIKHLVGSSTRQAGSLGYAAAVWHAFQAGGVLIGGMTMAALPFYNMMERLRANGIHSVDELYRTALLDPKVGQAMLARAIDSRGRPNDVAMNQLVRAVARSNVMLDTYQEDSRMGRPARQTGGRIMDHGAKADALVRMAERTRRAHATTTQQLLTVPDEHIARALAVANQYSNRG